MQIGRDLILHETSFMFFFILFLFSSILRKRSKINLDFFLHVKDFTFTPFQLNLNKYINDRALKEEQKVLNVS